jgi:VanZ family protein
LLKCGSGRILRLTGIDLSVNLHMISFIFSFKPWLRKTIAALYLVTIAVLSLMPSYDLPSFTIFPEIDKVVHICMYLGLSFLACWSFEIRRDRMKPLYFMLVTVFMYGILMEVLQRTMHNGRNFDFRDMIANLTGAIVGILIYRYFDRQRLKE